MRCNDREKNKKSLQCFISIVDPLKNMNECSDFKNRLLRKDSKSINNNDVDNKSNNDNNNNNNNNKNMHREIRVFSQHV